jgi:hypothetical protein
MSAAQILTANRLIDGDVVYYTGDGGWSTAIDAARLAADKDGAAALEAIGAKAVATQTIVAPYLIEVEEQGGRILPLRYRERIRAFGPSTHPELAKQARAG